MLFKPSSWIWSCGLSSNTRVYQSAVKLWSCCLPQMLYRHRHLISKFSRVIFNINKASWREKKYIKKPRLQLYNTCDRKEVWRPAISTPLMELERDIVGVLETVSTVNDFRSLNKKEKTNKANIITTQLQKKVHKMVKDRFCKNRLPFPPHRVKNMSAAMKNCCATNTSSLCLTL